MDKTMTNKREATSGSFKKGHVGYKAFLGKKLSLEHRMKLSESHKGIPKSPETIKKLKENACKYWLGRKLPKHVVEGIRKRMTDSWTGDKNPNWKGGVTDDNHSIRHSIEMKRWKKMCLKRDNFICQKTGKNSRMLAVHHIKSFAEFPELRFDLENGITFSRDAHLEFHKIYGKVGNTQEQVMEFIYG